jgi:D-alanine-D-alanine ligase
LEIVNSKTKIAVLTGGIGAERDISLQSGRCVAEALEKAGLDVVAADIQPDNLDILEDSSIDVFFPALHGKFGEDGRLQQILEDKSLLYTGSGPTASKLAFDKIASKKLFTEAGISTPVVIEFNAETDIRQLEEQLQHFADKYVVKPIRQGSSVGVSIVSVPHEAISVARETFSEFGDCMIEKFVRRLLKSERKAAFITITQSMLMSRRSFSSIQLPTRPWRRTLARLHSIVSTRSVVGTSQESISS